MNQIWVEKVRVPEGQELLKKSIRIVQIYQLKGIVTCVLPDGVLADKYAKVPSGSQVGHVKS